MNFLIFSRFSKTMSNNTVFSEKLTSSQTFPEPQNLTTIELDKCGYLSERIKNDNETDNTNCKKFKLVKIVKTLLIGIGLFILLGLCVTILIVLIHKSKSTSDMEHKNTSKITYSSMEMFLNTKENIKKCKNSRSLEECCNILFEAGTPNKMTKCTVQKVLDIFLQYELQANKRTKRQIYEHGEQINVPDYYFDDEHNYDYEMNAQNYYQDNIFNNYETEVSNNHDDNYFFNQDSLVRSPLETYQHHQMESANFPFHHESSIEPPELLRNQYTDYNLNSNSESVSSSTILPYKCPHNNCTNVIEASTKISNISNLKADPGKLEISFNNTKIQLKSKSRSSENRISQGSEFEIKQTNEVQASNGNKQVFPCVYPFPAPYINPYTNYESNHVFSTLPINQNIPRHPLYIINPPVYPHLSVPFQSYNNYQNPQIVGKTPIQVSGAGGQYYVCNPISPSTNNVVGLQGVEVRRTPEAFNLQELVSLAPKAQRNNKTREAIDCPFGTRACSDGSKCVHHPQVCDNEVNCDDASDETECSCKYRVGEIRWCDGYQDCPNGEDESNCFDCEPDEFSCDDWSRFQRGTCIPIYQRCDGIKQCEITGKDEEDCSILTDHLGQHPLNKVSNAVGFLHRNFKGVWYPTCFGSEIFSSEICRTEAGPNEASPKTHLVPNNDNYPGLFLDVSPTEGLILSNNCMKNKAAFVECPPIYCGLRLSVTNSFRNTEVDTSVEEFLLRRKHIKKSKSKEIVGFPRVVGGKPSQPTAWPWVVSIYKNGVFHCGGVLINDWWILTAAHCVDRFWFYYYEIEAGNLRRFSYSPMEQARWATEAIPHENYNKKTLKNDIALMKLSKPVRFNRYVRPICLPSEANAGPDYLHGPKANTVCTTVGWGATVEHGADPDHLREVEVPILSQCKHTEDKQGDEICAGLSEGGRDACQGDSGGPLMCRNVKNQNQWYLAGIVSHGEGCARPNEPGVYTRVSKYVGWIEENMSGKNVGKFPLQKCPGYVCLATLKCLPKKRHCDKVVDCFLGDDEINCWPPFDSGTLEQEIVGSKRNLIDHLLKNLEFNRSLDEYGSDTITESPVKNKEKHISETDDPSELFKCKLIFQTIPINEKCNRKVDCEDGTDESDCLCVDYLKRFDKGAICDGITDCKDISDEMDCVKCGENEYLCRTSQNCIPLESRCDRKADCINAEDEWDCVALTDGETLLLDSDLRPKQTVKGIITINRFGVWRPLCTNASVDNDASIAENVCNLLGFEEYTSFHKLPVEDKPLNVTIDGFERYHSASLNELSLCGGLFVRCLNVSLGDNIHKLYRDNITTRVELNTSPWNAVIYLDGIMKCTGTILDPNFIITAKSCLSEKLSEGVYVTALIGKGNSHLDVEGPHEQIVKISAVTIINNTEAMLLYTEQRMFFNRYVYPAEIPATSIVFENYCVATGIEGGKLRVVYLELGEQCTSGFWCFKIKKSYCKHKISHAWNGVITCNSQQGWNIAAVYTNIKDLCHFSDKEFAIINEVAVNIAMGNDLERIPSTSCVGFRCALGNCLEKSRTCDGIPDCRNSEDENSDSCLKVQEECHLSSNCTNLPVCKRSEFRCPDGSCIPKTSFCDTINNCKDLYDEPEECTCRTFLEVVHPDKICDGKINCWDRTDENPLKCNCQFPTNVSCGQSKLCISQEMVCDGFQDCPNGEDESQCYSLKTNLLSINSGEVLKNTGGVWHSGCFSENHTQSELEEICKRLGFFSGSARQLKPTKDSNSSGMNPAKDRFDIVWIRRGSGSGLKLRFRTGNEPYFRLVEDPDCYKLFIECL